MDLTQYLVSKLKEQFDKFHFLMELEYVNVCFWYIPKLLRRYAHDRDKEEEFGALCPKIKARMMKAGTLMIGYTKNMETLNFFRVVILQEGTNNEDIDFMLNKIDRLGQDKLKKTEEIFSLLYLHVSSIFYFFLASPFGNENHTQIINSTIIHEIMTRKPEKMVASVKFKSWNIRLKKVLDGSVKGRRHPMYRRIIGMPCRGHMMPGM